MQIQKTTYNKFFYSEIYSVNSNAKKAKEIASQSLKGESSVSYSKIMNKVDNFLNLGAEKNLSLDGMNDDEKKKFLLILSKLMKEGIIGYQYYEVDGKIEKHFITTSIGDKRLYNSIPKYDFDLRYGKQYA